MTRGHIFFIVILVLSILVAGHSSTSIASSKNLHSCQNFMTVMSESQPWNPGRESCHRSVIAIGSRLVILSTLMKRMNSSLTVYSTFQNISRCGIKKELPHVHFVTINATALLMEYYYDKALVQMRQWNVSGYTRTSDILRILLAHKYQQAYIDTDIYFLDWNRQLYSKPFVSVAIWKDVENSVEISNSAFCLQREILQQMMTFQRNRIENGTNIFFYTEIGPSMFHKVR